MAPAHEIAIRDYESMLDDAGAADLRQCVLDGMSLHGEIVECGSWRGGSAMFMADLMRRHGVAKRIFACDSYEGFELDELRDERAAGWTEERDDAFASTSLKYVEAKLRERGLQGVVVPVKGYFQETLASLHGPFSLVLIDCDLSRSARFAAETLWERVTPGGVVLFDDYDTGASFRGIRPVVERFVADHTAEIPEHGLMRRLYRVVRGVTA